MSTYPNPRGYRCADALVDLGGIDIIVVEHNGSANTAKATNGYLSARIHFKSGHKVNLSMKFSEYKDLLKAYETYLSGA